MSKEKKIQRMTIKRNGILAALNHRMAVYATLKAIPCSEVDDQAELAAEAAELETKIAYLGGK